jgi:hypothetical protein
VTKDEAVKPRRKVVRVVLYSVDGVVYQVQKKALRDTLLEFIKSGESEANLEGFLEHAGATKIGAVEEMEPITRESAVEMLAAMIA